MPLSAIFLCAGCAGTTSTLMPGGPSAQAIASLWWIMLAGSTAIFLLILLIIGLAWRRAPAPVSQRRWLIGGGIIFPMVVLTVLLLAGILLGERALIASGDPVVEVEARASQYGWRFSYPGTAAAATHGLLHIPAGRRVAVSISTSDVIHSFWVPRLGGKMDAIPGHVNRLAIEASTPGRYFGICAEYCGTGHARHGFEVIAHPGDAWPAFAQGRTR